MGNFKGYLLRSIVMNGTTPVYTVFPNRFIKFDSWSSNPKQREELKAYRDDNSRKLTRVTAEGKKTKITFTVRPLDLDDKIELQNFFYSAEVDHVQRKVHLQYWDDENNRYDEGYFYRPNMEFPINHIEGENIKYKELKMELIEY